MTPQSHRAMGAATVGRRGRARATDCVARVLITLCALSAIVILAAIFVFLVQGAWQGVHTVGLFKLITGHNWYPTSQQAEFGFMPSEIGSLWVTFVALLCCVPLGLAAAVYLSEFARPAVAAAAKTIVEFMAAIPSVVFGLIGLAVIVPLLQKTLHLDSGLTALCAGLTVGVVCLPIIISISEDALHSVPDDLRQGSYALGNTRWQTALKVVLPAASSGIFAAVMLGLGRAIGETMVVLMLAGNSGIVPHSPLMAVRTMTGTIAQETGEVVRNGLHYSVLFAMGLVLFAWTFVINLVADLVLERQRHKWRH